jgi:hypothetical protein
VSDGIAVAWTFFGETIGFAKLLDGYLKCGARLHAPAGCRHEFVVAGEAPHL